MTATDTETREIPRLKQRYRQEILPSLSEQFGYANVMQVPGLTKVVVNMGVGEAARDSKLIDGAVRAAERRVIVEGVNRVKRHTKVVQQGGRGGTTGGIVTQEAPIHVSNVMLLVDDEDGGGKVPTRIGFRRDEVTKTRPDGSTYSAHRSVRIATRTGKEI